MVRGSPDLHGAPALMPCESCGSVLAADSPWCPRCDQASRSEIDPAVYREVHKRLRRSIAAAFIVPPWAFYEVAMASRLLVESGTPEPRSKKALGRVLILAGIMMIPWILEVVFVATQLADRFRG